MEWKTTLTAFATVFLAELGDKTQLATFGLAAASQDRRFSVFLGSAGALVLTSLIAVVAGAALGKVVPAFWLERAGGVLMIGIGAWVLWKSRGA